MSAKTSKNMVLLEMDALESQGIYEEQLKTALEIQCFDKVFCRVSVLAKRYEEKAISICEEYISAGWETFITDNHSFLSVWKEKKSDSLTPSGKEIPNQIVIIKVTPEPIAPVNDLSENNQTSREKDTESSQDTIAVVSDNSYHSYRLNSRMFSYTVKELNESLEEEKIQTISDYSTKKHRQKDWWERYVS